MVDVNNFQQHLHSFFDPSVGFWSTQRMVHKIKQNDDDLYYYPNEYIQKKIEREPAWQRHTERRRNIINKHKTSINVHNIGSFQIDLADFTSFNDTANYLLVIIDVYSRFLIAFPLLTKNDDEYIPKLSQFIESWNEGEYYRKALQTPEPNPNLIKQNKKKSKQEIDDDEHSESEENNNNNNNEPNENHYKTDVANTPFDDKVWAISCDNEYGTNKKFQELCQKNEIEIYTSMPNEKSGKVSIVERVIRTIRGMLGRFFTYQNETKWVHIIDKLVDNYNNTNHRTIGVPPRWALGHKDKFQKPVPKKSNQTRKSDYWDTIEVGDWVRIPFELRNKLITKTNLPHWSKEVYEVMEKVHNRFIVGRNGEKLTRAHGRIKTFEEYNLKKVREKSSIPNEDRPDNQNISDSDDIDISTSNQNIDPHIASRQQAKTKKQQAKLNKDLDTFLDTEPKEKVRTIIETSRFDMGELLERDKQLQKKARKKYTKLSGRAPQMTGNPIDYVQNTITIPLDLYNSLIKSTNTEDEDDSVASKLNLPDL